MINDEPKLGQELADSTSPELGEFWCANKSLRDSLTPAETGTSAVSLQREVVPASAVVDTGSPTLKERTALAVSE